MLLSVTQHTHTVVKFPMFILHRLNLNLQLYDLYHLILKCMVFVCIL